MTKKTWAGIAVGVAMALSSAGAEASSQGLAVEFYSDHAAGVGYYMNNMGVGAAFEYENTMEGGVRSVTSLLETFAFMRTPLSKSLNLKWGLKAEFGLGMVENNTAINDFTEFAGILGLEYSLTDALLLHASVEPGIVSHTDSSTKNSKTELDVVFGISYFLM